MSTFTELMETFVPEIEYLCNDASGGLANNGSAGVTYDLTQSGTPTYQNSASADFEADGYKIDLIGGTSDDGFYKDNGAAALTAMATGSIVFVYTAPAATTDTFLSFEESDGGGTRLAVSAGASNRLALSIIGSGGVGVDEIDYLTTEVAVDTQTRVLVITQPGDGSGPQIYLDGLNVNHRLVTETVTSGDANLWFADLAIDSIGVGGDLDFSAGSFAGFLNEFDGEIEYLAIMSTVLSAGQVLDLHDAYYSGPNTRVSTVARRSSRRRVKATTSAPAGLDAIDLIICGGGSSAFDNILALRNANGTWVDAMNDTLFAGQIIEPLAALNTGVNALKANADGSVLFGNDLTSTTQMLGWKKNAYGIYEVIPSGNIGVIASNAQLQSVLWDPVNPNLAMLRYTNRAAVLFEYDPGSNSLSVVSGPFDTAMTRFGSSGIVGQAFSPDGAFWCMGSNTSGNGPIHLYLITGSGKTYTRATLVGANPTAIDAVAFGKNSDVLILGGFNEYAGYDLTDVNEWTRNDALFNNNADVTNKPTGSASITSAIIEGDDLYVGYAGSGGTSGADFQHIFHLRWNGSYYAEQADPEWPFTTAPNEQHVSISDIAISPVGDVLIVTTANSTADDIPSVLAYSRSLSTGALTLLDSPHPFWSADLDASTDQITGRQISFGSLPS